MLMKKESNKKAFQNSNFNERIREKYCQYSIIKMGYSFPTKVLRLAILGIHKIFFYFSDFLKVYPLCKNLESLYDGKLGISSEKLPL